ncbi:MAG: arsinothricin resistance N-acetyltransferase ArsN1 family B [Usitatibacter sp.]
MIRLATPADARGIHAIYAPVVRDTAISFELEAPDEAAIARRIEETLARFPWIVEEDAAGIAGYAYAGEHRERLAYQWSVDVSCYVHERARRRGIGKALYEALKRVLRAQGFRNAFAGVALPNAASIALHRSVGFVELGRYRNVGFKHGTWRDSVWLQCALGALDPDPAPPVPLARLARESIQAALDAS